MKANKFVQQGRFSFIILSQLWWPSGSNILCMLGYTKWEYWSLEIKDQTGLNIKVLDKTRIVKDFVNFYFFYGSFKMFFVFILVAFLRQDKDNKEFKLKVAQVYLKLGELGLETGQYGQSIEDFTQCLTRQKEQLEADSSLLAETYPFSSLLTSH